MTHPHQPPTTSNPEANHSLSEDIPAWLHHGHIPVLDGCRAVAVLCVLFTHACQTAGFPWGKTVSVVGTKGAIGVDMFFVISGFLITTLLIREKRRTGGISVSAFFYRRFVRIVPAYAALLLVICGMQHYGLASLRPLDWTTALTYTVNFQEKPAWQIGHVWSLSIEEHFYLVWPVVFAWSTVRFSARAAAACIGFSFLVRCGFLLWLPDHLTLAQTCTFTRMDTIAFGCVLALGVHDVVFRQRLDRIVRIPLMPLWLLVLLCLSILVCSQSTKIWVGLSYSLNGAILTLLLWALLRRAEMPSLQWLRRSWLTSIGLYSYSLYLWQQLFLNPRESHAWTAFPLNLILTVIAAMISYRCVETPFRNLKSRLAKGTVAHSAPGVAVDP